MIAHAIDLLVEQLNAFIPRDGGEDAVLAGNIAQYSDGDQSARLGEKVVLSLVNVEEETTLKNGAFKRDQNGQAGYFQRPVNLNLFLLFSANYSDYQNSMQRLSQVILFFQQKKVFTLANSPSPSLPEEAGDLRLIMDLHSLSFEQINYLWGSLGGKQVPFVLYKCRLVTIEAEKPFGKAPLIEQVVSRENLNE